jgi:hypothetical protein
MLPYVLVKKIYRKGAKVAKERGESQRSKSERFKKSCLFR